MDLAGQAQRSVLPLDGRKTSKVMPHLIADAAKKREPLLFGALQGGRILKAVVNHHGLVWKDRAAFPGVVAYGKNVIELPAGEFNHTLGPVRRCRSPTPA